MNSGAEFDITDTAIDTDVSERYGMPSGSAVIEMHPYQRDIKTIHVYQDGPAYTGHRYITSAAMMDGISGSIMPGGLLDAPPDRGA